MVPDPALQLAAPHGALARVVRRIRDLAGLFTDVNMEGRTRRAALFSVGARVFNAALLFLTHVLLARLLGVAEFGLFSLATTWVLALLGLGTLGLTMTPQRFAPDYAARGEHSLMAGLYRFAHLAPFVAGLLIALGGGAILHLFMPHLSFETRLVIGLALFALPALAVIDVVEGFALAHDWNDLAYGVTFILRPLLLPVLLLGAWLGGSSTALPAVMAFVASAWIAAICLVLLIRPRMRGLYPAMVRREMAPRAEKRRWLALALPALFADGAFLTMAYADVLLLSAFAPAAEVGVYVAATKIVGVVAFVHFGLSYASAHHFSRLHAEGEHRALTEYACKAASWTFWPSLVAASLLALAAPVLMGLFGKDFSGGAMLVPFLLVALVARAFIGPSEQLLMMTDRQRTVTAIYSLAAMLNVVLVLLLAPRFGALGVAFGAMAASLAATVATAVSIRRIFGCFIHAGSPHQVEKAGKP